ncbi:winged helix-turn-helix transcriptional regulator [Glycomyces arizonensis]|uniref:winged helix-turn-helix transcriptional regulator n=1 Tax=Glycomyces arizonensis TaxID=256035 RepID=UPI00041AFED2|nr:helix-turn-helix domain-containing protein [Glycomyces arizonensis]
MSTAPNIRLPEDFQVLTKDCPSRAVLEHVTGRWGTLVLIVLRQDPKRFSEIRRSVGGINEKALAQTLRALERDGFIERHASDGYPSRVEYSLTELGSSTTELLSTLAAHLERHESEVVAAQTAYDERH